MNAFGVVIVSAFESASNDENKSECGMCIISAVWCWLDATFFVHENKTEFRDTEYLMLWREPWVVWQK